MKICFSIAFKNALHLLKSVAFQLVLGASGGILLFLSIYFLYIETRRAELARRSTKWNWALGLGYAFSFSAAVITGIYG